MSRRASHPVTASRDARTQLEHDLPVGCGAAVAEWLEVDISVMQNIKDAIEGDAPSTLVLDMVNGVTAVKTQTLATLNTRSEGANETCSDAACAPAKSQ